MKRRSFAALLLFGAALLAGCGGGGSGSDIEDLDRQIFNANQTWATAIENEDEFALDLITSPNFLNNGTNKPGFLDAFEQIFDDYSNIEVTIEIEDIDYDDPDDPFYADVAYGWLVTGINRTTGNREVIDETASNESYLMTWRYEDSRWKLYGNQETTPFLSKPGATGALRGITGKSVPKRSK